MKCSGVRAVVGVALVAVVIGWMGQRDAWGGGQMYWTDLGIDKIQRVNLDGTGESKIDTGIGFLDHMLELFSRHSGIDLEVKASGDLHVDEHHLVEDVGLVLGQALNEALGTKSGIERYGSAMIPMDEVLVAAAVDLSGRFAFVSDYRPERAEVGDLPTELVPHFFRSPAKRR